MALLWSHRSGNQHYKVTSAGSTVRLFTNGVFHSQFNPVRPIGGALWDLLSLPSLLLPEVKGLRVLVLGVGGGAVIKQLQVLLQNPEIAGVDLDQVHLRIARRWFGVSTKQVSLVHADAVDWVKQYRGVRFDLVIDDLFAEVDGEPCRAIPMDSSWASALKKLVKPEGIIVVNYLDDKQLKKSALTSGADRSADTWKLNHAVYQNAIGIHGSQFPKFSCWRSCLEKHPGLSASQKLAGRKIRATRIRNLSAD